MIFCSCGYEEALLEDIGLQGKDGAMFLSPIATDDLCNFSAEYDGGPMFLEDVEIEEYHTSFRTSISSLDSLGESSSSAASWTQMVAWLAVPAYL